MSNEVIKYRMAMKSLSKSLCTENFLLKQYVFALFRRLWFNMADRSNYKTEEKGLGSAWVHDHERAEKL
jgi:hypothetical protein